MLKKLFSRYRKPKAPPETEDEFDKKFKFLLQEGFTTPDEYQMVKSYYSTLPLAPSKTYPYSEEDNRL